MRRYHVIFLLMLLCFGYSAEIGSKEAADADLAYMKTVFSEFTTAKVFKVGPGKSIRSGEVQELNGKYLCFGMVARPVTSDIIEYTTIDKIRHDLLGVSWQTSSTPVFNLFAAGEATVLIKDLKVLAIVIVLKEKNIDGTHRIIMADNLVHIWSSN